MPTWQRGREIITRVWERSEGPLPAFVDQLHHYRPPLLRVPGTAVFLNRGKQAHRWRCAPTSSTTACCTSTPHALTPRPSGGCRASHPPQGASSMRLSESVASATHGQRGSGDEMTTGVIAADPTIRSRADGDGSEGDSRAPESMRRTPTVSAPGGARAEAGNRLRWATQRLGNSVGPRCSHAATLQTADRAPRISLRRSTQLPHPPPAPQCSPMQVGSFGTLARSSASRSQHPG